MNIEPLIFVARSLSRMPSAAPVSQCGTRWYSGNSSRQPERSVDDRVVCVRRAVGGVGMRKVGKREQHVAQLGGDRRRARRRAGVPGRRGPGSAPPARRPRPSSPAGAAFADLLRQLVDAGPHGVSLGGDVTQAGVELGGGVAWSTSSGLPAAEAASTPSRSVRSRRTSITVPRRYRRLKARRGRAWRTRARRRRTSAPRRCRRGRPGPLRGAAGSRARGDSSPRSA